MATSAPHIYILVLGLQAIPSFSSYPELSRYVDYLDVILTMYMVYPLQFPQTIISIPQTPSNYVILYLRIDI